MFKNIEGQRVPNVTFKTRRDHAWVDLTGDDVFAGKNVIVFSLPGAFTPTCSSSHVPRYNQLAPVFKENGIDDIICMSVNDAFVIASPSCRTAMANSRMAWASWSARRTWASASARGATRCSSVTG